MLRLWEPPGENYRRLRPEKPQTVARGRGFDSRHLHDGLNIPACLPVPFGEDWLHHVWLPSMTTPPETQYATASDGLKIAYQVTGNGDVDLVFMQGAVAHHRV